MKKILKLSTILLTLAGGLACSLLARNQETPITATAEKPNNYVDCSDFIDLDCPTFHKIDQDTSASIIGKWQLIKRRHSSRGGERCLDFCQHNIVYEFKPNGILTISRNSEIDINSRVEEDHSYSLIVSVEKIQGIARKIFWLKTDKLAYWYRINSKELLLQVYHQPSSPTKYFIRIN